MKKLIRKGVFETNSSSCHSISVNESMVYNDIPKLDFSGNILLNSGEFGWEVETYHDFESKAAYLIVYIRDWCGDKKEEFKNILESIIKEVSGCESISYEDNFWETEKVSYEETTWNSVTKQSEKTGEVRYYDRNLGEGYIDHQSVEDKDCHFLFENIETLKSFLFNSASYIETDNDNH